MKPFVLSRRRLLRGAGDVALALPLLEAMLPRRRAHAAAPPKRLLVWFTGSGNMADQGKWRPTGTERNFTLSPILAPLEPHKHSLVIVDGLQIRGANGEGHTEGMGGNLTAMPLIPRDGGTGFASGISMDQVLAQRMPTTFRSLELSVGSKPGTVWGRLAYAGSNMPIPPQGTPQDVFTRVFANAGGDPSKAGQVAALREQRRTVLDSVLADYAALEKRLGKADVERIDQHMTSIRNIEKRLDAVGNMGAECKPIAPTSTTDFPTIGKLQMDLIVTAFACDLTRVVTFMWEFAAENRPYPFIGVADEHHNGFHFGKFDSVQKIMTWYSSQLAYLLDRLKQIPDAGGGTLLDDSLVFWTTEQGNGNNHSKQNMPYLLAGGAGGAVKTGRYLRYASAPGHPDLLIAILNAFDMPVKTFGNPAWCTGPLPGIVG